MNATDNILTYLTANLSHYLIRRCSDFILMQHQYHNAGFCLYLHKPELFHTIERRDTGGGMKLNKTQANTLLCAIEAQEKETGE